MRDLNLKVDPFEFLYLLDVQIDLKVNEHAKALVVGYISEDLEDQYVEKATFGQFITISAKDDEGENEVLFKGLIQSIDIQAENGQRKMTLEGISTSYLLDAVVYYQTFQDENMTYLQVLDIIKMKTGACDIYMAIGKDQPLGELVVQYQETNWAFAKRLASHFNSYLVPDYKMGGNIKFYFGKPNREHLGDLTAELVSMKKDLKEYNEKKESCNTPVKERDAICYQLISREVYPLCATATIKEGRELMIYQIHSQLEGAELVHYYTLKTDVGFESKKQDNPMILGASLESQVLAVEKDQVKLQINIDPTQDPAKAKWFTYSTVYSSTQDAGWYCMPEIGDFVRLYFPDAQEKNAFVTSSVHMKGGEGRSNPDHKILKNRQGKEIRFTPDAIIITNNNGMSIVLSDTEGISINSDKTIKIQSQDSINLSSAQGSINMIAADSLQLLQNQTQLILQDELIFKGGQVKIQ